MPVQISFRPMEGLAFRFVRKATAERSARILRASSYGSRFARPSSPNPSRCAPGVRVHLADPLNKKAPVACATGAFLFNGSGGGTRTPDMVINSHLLYRLSYS